MSKPLRSFYDATKYLGQFIGQKVSFLQNTSCMDQETRELIAILDFCKITFVDDKEFIELIDFILPLIEKLGYAKWQRDTVTDMALCKGSPSEMEDWDESTDNENTEENADSS